MNLKLSFEALAALDAIDRKGSFAAAAAELHRVPSALSYTVGRLEEDLDVRLFDRRGRRALLTPAGRELLDEGRHLLERAVELECRVRQVAKGWEVELRIAVDNILPVEPLLSLVAEFDRENGGTRLRLSYEVLGGTWDALLSGRADLAIGAGGNPPVHTGLRTRQLAEVEMLFAVSPGHALADVPEPLSAADIRRHRAVAVGDSSRNLPPQSTGLQLGQDTLTVPDFAAKLAAQRMGLGVGYLPAPMARREAEHGRLVIKQVAEPKRRSPLYAAWRDDHKGRALAWFLKRLEQMRVATLSGGEPGRG